MDTRNQKSVLLNKLFQRRKTKENNINKEAEDEKIKYKLAKLLGTKVIQICLRIDRNFILENTRNAPCYHTSLTKAMFRHQEQCAIKFHG